jgi:hypothetical protein
MAAHRKGGVFARSINDRYQHSEFCVVHCHQYVFYNTLLPKLKTKLHGLSPRANYTDGAAAAGRRS